MLISILGDRLLSLLREEAKELLYLLLAIPSVLFVKGVLFIKEICLVLVIGKEKRSFGTIACNTGSMYKATMPVK